jgi:hypothetical protein
MNQSFIVLSAYIYNHEKINEIKRQKEEREGGREGKSFLGHKHPQHLLS